MVERSDLSAELRRWFISVFFLMASVVGLFAWQISILYEIEKKLKIEFGYLLFEILSESIILGVTFLLVILLWHYPTMVAASSVAPARAADRKGYSIFIAILAPPLSVWMWGLVERANCYHRLAFQTQSIGPFWEACRPSAYATLAAWFVLGLLGLLVLRAVFLLVSHLWKKFRHGK